MLSLVSNSRQLIKRLAAWENTPTTFKAPYVNSSAECLAKFGARLATGAISSMPVVATATTAFPLVAAWYGGTLGLGGGAVAASALWFFRRNHNQGVKETLERQTEERHRKTKGQEQTLKTQIIESLGGDTAISAPRSKPAELKSGLLEYREEHFPVDKAVVKSDNSAKMTVFGLRIQDKVTRDIHYVSVSYAGGKLQIESPEEPDLRWSVSTFSQIANKTHSRFELVPPQGKELTLLQQKVLPMVKMVKEHDGAIKELQKLEPQVEAQTELIKKLLEIVEDLREEVATLKGTAPKPLQKRTLTSPLRLSRDRSHLRLSGAGVGITEPIELTVNA